MPDTYHPSFPSDQYINLKAFVERIDAGRIQHEIEGLAPLKAFNKTTSALVDAIDNAAVEGEQHIVTLTEEQFNYLHAFLDRVDVARLFHDTPGLTLRTFMHAAAQILQTLHLAANPAAEVQVTPAPPLPTETAAE